MRVANQNLATRAVFAVCNHEAQGTTHNHPEDCKSISMSFLRKNGYFDSPWPQGIVWTNRRGEETASRVPGIGAARHGSFI